MKTDISRQSLVAAFLTLAAVVVAAFGFGAEGGASASPTANPLPGDPIGAFQMLHPAWARMLACGCILLTSLILGRLSARYNLCAGRCYLTIPLFGLAACGMMQRPDELVQCLSALLLALTLKNYCKAFRNGYGFDGMFRASLYLGMLPLLCPPALPLFLLLALATFLFRRTLRELCVALFGMVLPAFAVCYLVWAAGGTFAGPLCRIAALFREHLQLPDLAAATLLDARQLFYGLLVLLTLCAVAIHLQNIYIVGRKARLILALCICMFLLTLCIGTCSAAHAGTAALTAVPVSLLLPLFFVHSHRSLSLAVYLLLLACGLASMLS